MVKPWCNKRRLIARQQHAQKAASALVGKWKVEPVGQGIDRNGVCAIAHENVA